MVDERINLLTTVPAIYWLAISQPAFAEVDISRVRSVSYGGAPIAPAAPAPSAPAEQGLPRDFAELAAKVATELGCDAGLFAVEGAGFEVIDLFPAGEA